MSEWEKRFEEWLRFIVAVPAATNQYGPVKTGTPTALALAQARRAEQGGGAR